jgi:DtxR family Mn-dependent transcriptional regulator|nr:MAG: DNA-binding protein [Thermoproteus sp. AZ2]
MRRGHAVKDVRPEHYLEAVYLLSRGAGRTTLSEVAEAVGVKPSSAHKMLRRLAEEGLVEYKGREGVALTQKGAEYVENMNKAHRALAEFFKLIGVEEGLAEAEAEKLEHVVDPRVVEKIAELTTALKSLLSALR